MARAIATAMLPPPPPDITRWCEDNLVFDERSPIRGPFSIRRFPFLREIHEVLSPEDPNREVTVMGSAQWGKTVSIIQPTIGSWHAYAALDSLVVHPTASAATEWVDNKWLPMRRQAQGLIDIFGDGRSGGDNKDAKFNQETLLRNGSLKVASAGSPADLTGTSRRLVIMDDVAKWEMTDKGDPEALAESRASGFEDAKILRVSTPLIKGTCRISRAFARSDQRHFHVPCPHCGVFAPLTWENFRARIDPERLHAAHFTCESCGGEILHADKERIIGGGRWVRHNPNGDHPGFFLWRAYAPQRDWASIAVEYARVQGWSRLAVTQASQDTLQKQVEAETEQTFYNDVLGLPYEQAGDAPSWEALRDRAEDAAPECGILDKMVLPATGFILAAGADCQDDRTEVQVVAYCINRLRVVVDYRVIPYHISTQECTAALDAILKTTWRTSLGLPVPLDILAIDGGTYTDDVWSWARKHPWDRVIVVKGSSSQTGPVMLPMKFERKNDGSAKRLQKRGFMLNVSQMKGDFYTWLHGLNPTGRGFCQFARGMGDEYYRQLASETKVLSRTRTGTVIAAWKLVEPTRRNEALDTMLYSEAAARRKGWASMTDEQWERLADIRGYPPADRQGDLFDATAAAVGSAPVDAPVEDPRPGKPQEAAQQKKPGHWNGVRRGKWW